jgi:hypothetical protein
MEWKAKMESSDTPVSIYQYLIQTAVSTQELIGTGSVALEALEGQTGALCTLFGRKHVYQIRLECHFPVPIVCLDIGEIDDPASFQNVGGGDAEDIHNWRLIVLLILEAEGIREGIPA